MRHIEEKRPETRAERLRRASQERREQERRELKQQILDAAAALFLEDGYEAFSMRQIAERIGYSATTIYRYFADKDALLFAVVDEGFAQFTEALARAAQSTDDPLRRIEELGIAYVTFGFENPSYYRLMFMQRGDYLGTPPEEGEKPRISAFGLLLRAVEQALEAGVLRPGDARAYGNYLWAVTHGIVSLTIAMPELGLFPSRESVAETLRVSLDGISQR